LQNYQITDPQEDQLV